jgi:hypothetical protein
MVGTLRLEEVSISKGFCLRRKKTNKLLQPNNNEGGCVVKGKGGVKGKESNWLLKKRFFLREWNSCSQR